MYHTRYLEQIERKSLFLDHTWPVPEWLLKRTRLHPQHSATEGLMLLQHWYRDRLKIPDFTPERTVFVGRRVQGQFVVKNSDSTHVHTCTYVCGRAARYMHVAHCYFLYRCWHEPVHDNVVPVISRVSLSLISCACISVVVQCFHGVHVGASSIPTTFRDIM